MFIEKSLNLENFFRKLLGRKFISPKVALKYTGLLLKKKQNIYKYLWNDFQKYKVYKSSFYKPTERQRITINEFSKFINNSLKRKYNREKYINRKMYYEMNRNIYLKKNTLLHKYVILRKLKKRKKKKVKKIKSLKNIHLDKNLKEFAQIKPIRVITRFRNLLAKKGKLFKAEKLINRLRYLIKLSTRDKKNLDLKRLSRTKSLNPTFNKVFFKVLTWVRPVIILKSVKKGKNTTVKPISLSLQRSTSLAQRNLMSSITNRKERLLISRVFSEFISIYKKKTNSTQTSINSLRKDIRKSYAFL